MINEIIQYFLERSSSHARKFGHLKESIAILQRQKRNKEAWSNHQENCQNEIITFCNLLKQHDSILVLGSGPLHEIPLVFLQQKFKKVILVDIVHLAKVRKQTSKYKNIELIEHDISEIEHLLVAGKLINKIPTRFLNENYSGVISANLMSQIPHNLKKYIHKSKLEIDENKIETFCTNAYINHLDYLKKFTCPILIITDIETNLIDNEDQIVECDSPNAVSILPKSKREWIWKIAPKGEIDRELSLQMKVASIILDKN